MKTLVWSVMGGAVCAAFVGCSASGDGGGGAGGSGNKGGNGTGAGGLNLSGTSSTSGTPSLGGDINSGATGGSEMGCNDLTVETKEVTPTVLLLVDNSSSMFDPMDLWTPLQNVLMKAGDGVVASLQEKVRFGFTSYRGSNMANDPACPNLFEVDYGLNNYDAIKTTYDQQGAEWKPGAKWETPTGAAIQKAAAKLAAYNPDPPGPKYIVLVTDGNPNTCLALDPQCGSDESIKAVQDAKAMGIGTYAVGIGDIITNNSGCEVQWGRCGVMHLQDIANAGQGLPVQAPPEGLKYQACTPTNVLAGTYAAATETPGTAPYFTAQNEAELKTALSGLLNSVVSCTYDMDAKVVGDAALGTVKINGVDVPYNDPNGWKLEDNKVQVTLQGSACETFKSTPNAELFVSFPCKVAVPK